MVEKLYIVTEVPVQLLIKLSGLDLHRNGCFKEVELLIDRKLIVAGQVEDLSLNTEQTLLGTFYERTTQPTYEDGIAEVVRKAQASGPPKLDEILAAFN